MPFWLPQLAVSQPARYGKLHSMRQLQHVEEEVERKSEANVR